MRCLSVNYVALPPHRMNWCHYIIKTPSDRNRKALRKRQILVLLVFFVVFVFFCRWYSVSKGKEIKHIVIIIIIIIIICAIVWYIADTQRMEAESRR